ncbi:MAG: PepSY domain-containing protein [Coprobacillus sp.]
MKLIKGLIIGCLALTLTACSNGDKNTTQKISLADAKSIALKHANLTEDKITYGETGADTINGVYQYEIEFKDGDGKEYDYQIHGGTGEIIKFDHMAADKDQTTTSQNNLTMKQAQDIALNHAKVKEADVQFTQTKQDTDDGVKVYDIEFNDKNKAYEYEINLQSGAICSYHYKKKNTTNSTGKAVTLEEAKSIVLKDAKVTDTNIKFITAKEDTDDGVKVYELKFQNANKIYDYEVEKATGDILSYEVK